ncbi:MAG: helix-turn-helix transcriptional regulator [Rhodobacteraceae bacterium]|nr:helix-turn-helix transcriptional regulator [Paracoccaceae bacterium]
MQENGLTVRRDHQTMPPHVEYALTGRGQALRPVLKAMHGWATEHTEMPEDAS